jgi:hypothetical protein
MRRFGSLRSKWLLALLLAAGLAGGWILAAQPTAPAPNTSTKSLPWQKYSDDPRLGDPYPKAVVEKVEHFFGEMDVGQSGRHTFTVRNEGPGRLHFDPGETSCHCTAMIIETPNIGPGEEGRITLEWHTTRPTEKFLHGGWIKTDDPLMRQIRFAVAGVVRARFSAVPAEATFAAIAQSDKASGRVTLYTQVWDELEITHVDCESAAVSWRTQPTAPATAADLKAKWAQDLVIEANPGLPLGTFQTALKVHARPKNDPAAEPVVRDVILQGQVVPDMSLAAPGYANGVLDLGMITQGKAARAKLHAFIRGEQRELDVAGITAEPGFLDVQISRNEQAKGKAAHYVIEIAIPADAPLANHLRDDDRGQIRIELRHPTLSEIRFGLKFAVVPDPSVFGRRAAAAPASLESTP